MTVNTFYFSVFVLFLQDVFIQDADKADVLLQQE